MAKPYYQDCPQEKIASTNPSANQTKVHDGKVEHDYDSPAFRLSCSFWLLDYDSTMSSMVRKTGDASGNKRFDGREGSWRHGTRARCRCRACGRGGCRGVGVAATLLPGVCLRELLGALVVVPSHPSWLFQGNRSRRCKCRLNFVSNYIGARLGPETRKSEIIYLLPIRGSAGSMAFPRGQAQLG